MAIYFRNNLKFKSSRHFINHIVKYLFEKCDKYIKKPITLIWPLFNRSLMLALTYQCQCKCEHCGSALYKQDKTNELKKSEILVLIHQARKLGAKGIYFFGGEPLIVSELPYYIRYAKQKGFGTKVDTNGFLLDENKVKQLKDSGIDVIGVSIDSPHEAIHDKLRGIDGIFKKAINGIKYCNDQGIRCYISTYATKENLKNGDLERIINLAKELGVKTRILSTICCGNLVNRSDLILSSQEIGMLKRLLEKDKVYWEAEKCAAFEKRLFYVTAYGDIHPCCFFPVTFGNIRKEPLKKIIKKMWNSKMFTSYQKTNDCPTNKYTESLTKDK